MSTCFFDTPDACSFPALYEKKRDNSKVFAKTVIRLKLKYVDFIVLKVRFLRIISFHTLVRVSATQEQLDRPDFLIYFLPLSERTRGFPEVVFVFRFPSLREFSGSQRIK